MIEIDENAMPITVAEKLILATKEVKILSIKHDIDAFDNDDLREIALHLLAYCSHGERKESEE